MEESLLLPQGVSAQITEGAVKLKGPNGEIQKKLVNPKIKIVVEGNKVLFQAKNATKREKTMIGTFRAHVRNMVKSVIEGHTYRLRVCSGHFPMTVNVSNNEVTVKNFFGEKVPRVLKIMKGAEVKLDGNEITVSSMDKDIAGQVAADIENLTRIRNKDLRIFQDGIYIIEKSTK